MTPEELDTIQETLRALQDSGLLNKINEPGMQTTVVWTLIILVGVMAFRLIVVNGVFKKVIQFHTDSIESRRKLAELLAEGVKVFKEIRQAVNEIREATRRD